MLLHDSQRNPRSLGGEEVNSGGGVATKGSFSYSWK